MYGEDADLCFRAAGDGAMLAITPDATIVHYCGASEKVRTDKMIRLFRAKEQPVRRNWSPMTGQMGLVMLRFFVLSRMIACNFLNFVNSKRLNNNDESWKEIWQRRKELQTS